MAIGLTGHTGFKGSWLSVLLQERGRGVAGMALNPEVGSLFELLRLASSLDSDERLDIRDQGAVEAAIHRQESDFIFHLAAQPLVRQSYRSPEETIATNVTGTMTKLNYANNSPAGREGKTKCREIRRYAPRLTTLELSGAEVCY